MSKTSFLQPDQIGTLAIRVLMPDLIEKFQNLHHDFPDELKHEVYYEELNRSIEYNANPAPINTLAELRDDGTICVYEPYLAFLWCLCYCVVVFYKERDKDTSKSIPYNEAIELFNYAQSLHVNWSSWNLDLPNPELCDPTDDNIAHTNGLFIFAACFILCHEFSHKQLGHSYEVMTSEQSIMEEFAADTAALATFEKALLRSDMAEGEVFSIQLGAILGMGSILFPHDSLDGGLYHPNSEERLYRTIQFFSEEDGEFWEFGRLLLILWGLTNRKTFDFGSITTLALSVRQRYRAMADQLKTQQRFQ